MRIILDPNDSNFSALFVQFQDDADRIFDILGELADEEEMGEDELEAEELRLIRLREE